jgi:hypothetical protein
MKTSECVLYSGGLKGAEAAFGAAAERHAIKEVNFTFDGHVIERKRGIRTLSEEELRQGDVSLAYVSKLLRRHLPDTQYIKRVLQTIWHQVNNAREIFIVGKIQADETVMGGTGWGAEFAKLCNKPLFVLTRRRTPGRTGPATRGAVARTAISHPHFAGSGTRYLSEKGKAAIDRLFADSFPRP